MTDEEITAAARWGLKGDDWLKVRAVKSREAAFGWANDFIRRGAVREWVDVYVDRGDGWVLVERITAVTA